LITPAVVKAHPAVKEMYARKPWYEEPANHGNKCYYYTILTTYPAAGQAIETHFELGSSSRSVQVQTAEAAPFIFPGDLQ
jgi:hypothetical protein